MAATPDQVQVAQAAHIAALNAIVAAAHTAPATARIVSDLAAAQAQVATLTKELATAEGPEVQKAKKMLDWLQRMGS